MWRWAVLGLFGGCVIGASLRMFDATKNNMHTLIIAVLAVAFATLWSRP